MQAKYENFKVPIVHLYNTLNRKRFDSAEKKNTHRKVYTLHFYSHTIVICVA